MKKLVIFDVDGTILNTIPTISYHVNSSLEHFGLKKLDESQYRYILGYGSYYLINEAIKLSKGEYLEKNEVEEVLNYYDKLYRDNPLYLTESYDGIEDLFRELKKRGYLLACYSNKQHGVLTKVIDQFYNENWFEYVLGQKKGMIGKPDPKGLYDILEHLNISKEEAILIGDTEVDINTGKNAGVYTIACTWGFRTKEDLEKLSPNAIIGEAKEVLNYL